MALICKQQIGLDPGEARRPREACLGRRRRHGRREKRRRQGERDAGMLQTH